MYIYIYYICILFVNVMENVCIFAHGLSNLSDHARRGGNADPTALFLWDELFITQEEHGLPSSLLSRSLLPSVLPLFFYPTPPIPTSTTTTRSASGYTIHSTLTPIHLDSSPLYFFTLSFALLALHTRTILHEYYSSPSIIFSFICLFYVGKKILFIYLFSFFFFIYFPL